MLLSAMVQAVFIRWNSGTKQEFKTAWLQAKRASRLWNSLLGRFSERR